MTDGAWVKGLHDLAVAFPDRDMSPGFARDRGQLYREHLDSLSDEAWLYAVREAVERDKWFPTIAALREYAEFYRSATLALPAPRRTPEQIEADRETARKGLELIKAAVANRPAPVLKVSIPEPSAKVVDISPDRVRALKEQLEAVK